MTVCCILMFTGKLTTERFGRHLWLEIFLSSFVNQIVCGQTNSLINSKSHNNDYQVHLLNLILPYCLTPNSSMTC